MTGVAPNTAHAYKLPPIAVIATASVLLILHFVMAVGSKLHESTTSDELVHLSAGTSYWQNHDYRLQPENGILPQRWAALPAWLAGTKFPDLRNNVYWRTSDSWVVGYQFFYETGDDHFPRLMAGRAMIGLFSVATGILVFCWSRRLFGDAGALVSLVLYAFCPTFLAHGALVTSDMCMAFFFLAACGAWWRQLHDGRARVWWLSALTLGLAFVAKYSAVLLPPMMVLMAAIRALGPQPLAFAGRTFSTRGGKFGAAALSALGHAVVVAFVIWACYGFRYSAFNPLLPSADQFIRPWSFMEERIGAAGSVIHALANVHALPEAFLYGLAFVTYTASSRAAFLNGDYGVAGWPTFFPWAFILKTTVPMLLICVTIAGSTALRWAGGGAWRRNLYRVTPLLVLFVVYWLSSLASHLNIGHRHLLPTYPVLFIAAGALSAWVTSGNLLRIAAVVILLGWHMTESIRAAPHYIAYFNPLGGGPDNGWRHLVDSSIDWGQDLPGLKTWLDKYGDQQPVFLSYFGTGEPDYYGIKATRMPFLNLFGKINPWYDPQGGLYCISATILQQVYSPFRGEWRLEWEKEYQEGRLKEPLFREYWKNPTVRKDLQQMGAASAFEETWVRYDKLRLARLCHYLRVRPPDANIGHSILIYRLTAAEVAGATTGTLTDWYKLIEKVSAGKP
jgi:hypothetical protein